VGGCVHSVPVQELMPYVTQTDPCVAVSDNGVRILRPDGSEFGYTWEFLHLSGKGFEGERPLRYDGPVNDVQILRSEGLLEVFINDGTCNFTLYPDS